jgi:hypothetical protein
MRKTLQFFVLGFAVCHSSGETRAADPATCDAYAQEASAPAVREAMEVCGYSGDAWNPADYLGHHTWCLRTSAQTVQAERDRRRDALQKCDRCKVYAKDAVDTQQFNDPEGRIRGASDGYEWPPMPCGFSGDAWSSDFKGHVRWCMGASEGDTRRETENRKAFADICRTCREYAHKAVVAYHNVWDKCKSFWSNPKMSGPQWSLDHQSHLRWCLALPAEGRSRYTGLASGERASVVEACRAKVSAPLTIQPAAKAELRRKVPAEAKRAATKPVAAARKSADTDAGKSSSTKKQSGSAAMDRLGGGSSGGAGSSGTASTAKARSSSSSAAQPASSATGGGSGGGVAPLATGVNRNAIGGGSPERVR